MPDTSDFKNLQVIIFAMPPDRLAMFESVDALDKPDEVADELEFSKDFTQFVEPVGYFDRSRKQALICLVCDEQMNLRHLAKGYRGHRAGTGLAQIKLSHKQTLSSPFPVKNIFDSLAKKYQHNASAAFMSGGLIPSKTSHAVLETLLKLFPDAKTTIDKSLEVVFNPLNDLSDEERFAFHQQKDAVLLSFQLAGIDRKRHIQTDFQATGLPKSYLEGLAQSRLREDAMINNDLNYFPGFQEVKRFVQNGVVFSDNRTVLTILLVNRQPLETTTGTDLIYYNDTFKSFVMVQYKAMEKNGKDPFFRIPNADLDKEIAKMQAVFKDLQAIPADQLKEPSGYRIHHNPFFLKFCPRVLENPDDVELTPGMYMPLDYWLRLSDGDHLQGSKGGKALRYENAGRYLNNTDFTMFVGKAWIGTYVEHSTILEQVIQRTLETGKSVTIAHVRQELSTSGKFSPVSPMGEFES